MRNQPHIDVTTPVGQIARFYPAAVAVFEAFDVDFACKGGRSLLDAATAAGSDADAVLEAVLESSIGKAAEGTVAELIHRIVTQHHRFETNRLRSLLAQLESSDDSDVMRIRRIVADILESMSAHMLREERTLFPQIEELDLHPHRVRGGSVTRPLLTEFVEHDLLHERFTKLRELALRVCARRRDGADALLGEVDTLSRDVHRHIHLENNVLIPRVVELENRLKAMRSEASDVRPE